MFIAGGGIVHGKEGKISGQHILHCCLIFLGVEGNSEGMFKWNATPRQIFCPAHPSFLLQGHSRLLLACSGHPATVHLLLPGLYGTLGWVWMDVRVERELPSICTARQQPHFSAWRDGRRRSNSTQALSHKGDSVTWKVPRL